MEKYYMNKKEFAAKLGISISTLERREKDVNYVLPPNGISREVRQKFMELLCAWELKRQEKFQKKNRDVI